MLHVEVKDRCKHSCMPHVEVKDRCKHSCMLRGEVIGANTPVCRMLR